MASLYQLTGDYLVLHDMLENGELTQEEQAEGRAIEERLLGDLLPEKVENYCRFMAGLKGEAAMLKAEEERLHDRRKAREALHDRLKASLLKAMQTMQMRTVKAQTFTVTVAKNPPALEITDQAAIPEWAWLKQEPVIDRKGITAALKAQQEIPGCRLVQGESLRIK